MIIGVSSYHNSVICVGRKSPCLDPVPSRRGVIYAGPTAAERFSVTTLCAAASPSGNESATCCSNRILSNIGPPARLGVLQPVFSSERKESHNGKMVVWR